MHVDLIAELQTHPEVKLHTLGMTTDGHDMDLLQIGPQPPGRGSVCHKAWFEDLCKSAPQPLTVLTG